MESNDSSWQSLVVVGGGGGGLGCWERFWGRRGEKNMYLYTVRCICNLQDSPKQNFALLGELTQLRLA